MKINEEEINDIVEKLKSQIKDEKDKAKDSVEYILNFINERIKEKGIRATTVITGSYARGTWVYGESDVDIYVVFEDKRDIGRLKELVPEGFSTEKGTREYFVGYINNIKFEIVPILKIKDPSEAENSLDLSVFHTSYVKQNIDGLEKEVYLLKEFMKGAGVYGAESYIRGFSGYATEVLIIKYRGILNLFKDVLKWKEKTYLDKTNDFESDSLILIDPTNPERNITASVSQESLARFVYYVKLFLLSPSEYFFKDNYEERIVKDVEKRKSEIIKIKEMSVRKPETVYLSKLRKAVDDYNSYMKQKEYPIIAWLIPKKDKPKIIFEMLNSKIKIVKGPPPFQNIENLESFIETHKEVFLFDQKVSYAREVPEIGKIKEEALKKVEELFNSI